MVMHVARKLGKDKSLIRIHLDDQMDSKTLLGSYVCTDTPGEFLWKAGALTQAVQQGRWVLIEDMDLAPFEILSALIPLLESGRLYIPSRNYTVNARQGFRLFGTRTTGQAGRRESAGLPMLQALTTQVAVEAWKDDEVAEIVGALYPNLKEHKLVGKIAELHALLTKGTSGTANQVVPGVRYRRVLTTRDLLKLCSRVASQLPASSDNGYVTENQRELILREAMDCFCNVLPAPDDRLAVARRIATIIDVQADKVEYMHLRHKPDLKPQGGSLQVGRIYLDELDGSRVAAKLCGKSGEQPAIFCGTVRAMQTMEAVAAAVHHCEPALLTGETGTGKTSLVQHLASRVGAHMVVVNLNQQSDSGDLLGGFKPVEVRQLAQELMDDLMELLPRVTSKSKNTAFIQSCRDKFEAQKWKPLTKLMTQAAGLVESLIEGGKASTGGGGDADTAAGGKRKGSDGGGEGKKSKKVSPQVRRQWRAFSDKIGDFARKVEAIKGKFAFAFVEGVLVKAIREGHWLLLDEVNLAPAETLERLSGLLDGDSGSVALTEKGDIDVVQRHPNFRLFACMNPATDVGKKDLPVALRARFTEVFVDEMEEASELREVVQGYLRGTTKNQDVVNIVQFYLEARTLMKKGDLFDGANQKVHFNLRSLTRTLQYVNFMQMQGYTFERALFEGACMVFATQLNPVCQPLMDKAIMRNLCKTKSTAGNSKPSLSNPDEYVCMGQYTHDKAEFTGFYLMKGEAYGKLKIPSFILTPSCQLNLRNIVRAAAPHRYPILLQGPTSAGKTSMIEYLAASTGHEFVRINNHAHTDVQEYLGGYASDRFGKLVFCEGPLVKALRGGHWLVLDELNLAPSEVLEMLNRLLDDNRELLIPETQETVKPHAHFMLFATQNPAGGAYGGRKMMSRAFRNRFLEVHVDDIPHEELKEMIEKRCKIPPSRAERIVGVMRELHRRRQRSNVFAGRHAFVTPRDLFKWADRIAAAATDNYDLMAQEGYMLLAEGLRRKEEKECVQDVLQKVVKVSVDVPQLYSGGWDLDVNAMLSGRPARSGANVEAAQGGAFDGLVHTKSAKRLLRLVARCMRFQEPVLLVGETGTGKTTVCQAFATALGNKLHIVNCHQNSETSDLIGGFRPIRGKDAAVARFRSLLERYYTLVREAWTPVPSTAYTCDASNGVHKSADDSMDVEEESGNPPKTSMKDADSDGDSEEEEEKMPVMPTAALPQDSREWLPMEEVSTGDAAHASRPSEGWIGGADVMDLIGQFENSWECVRPVLNRLSRCHAADEDDEDAAAAGGTATVPQQLKAVALQVEEQVPNCRALFTWYDGPLVTAMRDGDLLLIDEISLADDSVLERLNSVLEPSRTLTIAEKGGEVIVAHPEFRVLATMNPGGDFGKKELSPALRNRFTEIWIDAISDMDDLRSILAAHLKPSLMQAGDGDRLLKFWGWIIAKDGGAMRRLLSLRDLLSWTHFMNMAQEQGLNRTLGFLHGASMVLLDGLGVGDGSSDRRAKTLREECYAFLLKMIPEDERLANLGSTTELISGAQKVTTSATAFGMHPFHIPMGPEPEVSSFSMTAPTTSQNLVRVLRGLQLKRPILLEGSPGVGKTTLIQALASVTGHRLVRINLSDQTDMMDLLGTDLPVDGGGGGAQFAWSDGVFLSALKAGDWVLLDELNLASQSVLEGLNACLDHRAEVYLPELGQTFACPPSFRIFAAQNPLHQGGGRKGLPASFLNRFTSVRVEELNADDLLFIALAAYPEIGEDLLRQMISFNVAVHHHVTYVFAISGRPWEFNLRDIFRWCELMRAHQDAGRWAPEQFIEVLYTLRLRTASDREKLAKLYCTHFGVTLTTRQSIPFRVTPQTLQVGGATLQRTAKRELNNSTALIVPGLLQPLEALMYCVRMGWMGIVVGPPAVGKTSLIRILASYTGNHLREVAMTSDTDTTDLLGCFEQVDVQRKRRNFVVALNAFHEELMRALLTWQGNNPQALAFMAELSGAFAKLRGTSLNGHPQASSSLHNPAAKAGGDAKQSAGFSAEQAVMLSHLLTMATQGLHKFVPASANTDPDVGRQVAQLKQCVKGLAAELDVLKVIERERVTGCFEWMDGLLVQALETGDWVLLDNVNLCNPTVLDRLNPLLEPGGVLMVNERGLVNGQVTIVKPHPNFRLFLCLDPQRGEISRAMRNRGVEMCLLDSQLGSKDLIWLLSSLGLPGCELPKVMIEHHYELVKISGRRSALF